MRWPGLPLEVAGLLSVLVPVMLTVPPLIMAGLPLVAASTMAVRRLGIGERTLASRLPGLAIAEPASFRPEAGLLGWMRSALTDQPAWRARAYFVAKVLSSWPAWPPWLSSGPAA